MSIEAEWIEWKGGKCPVESGTLVDARDGDGYEWRGKPATGPDLSLELWLHDCSDYDAITAYRIHNAFEGAPEWATHLILRKGKQEFVKVKWYESEPEEVIHTSYQILASRKGQKEIPKHGYISIKTGIINGRTNVKCMQDFALCKDLIRTGKLEGAQQTISDLMETSTNDEAYLVVDEPEYTGGSVSYYTVRVEHPTNQDRDPYTAECNDVIEALQMNYAEGNAFKAIWRKCAARLGSAKKGYTDGLYDAEKVVFFGQRMVEQERNK